MKQFAFLILLIAMTCYAQDAGFQPASTNVWGAQVSQRR